MIQKVTGGLLGSRKCFEMGIRELRLMPAEKSMVAYDFVFVVQKIELHCDGLLILHAGSMLVPGIELLGSHSK